MWLVAAFVAVMTLVSYYPQLFHKSIGNDAVIVNQTDIQSIKLSIEGMVCTGCEENINYSVKKLDGILEINTSYIKGTSEIKFDSTKTSVNEIEEVIQIKGYRIKK